LEISPFVSAWHQGVERIDLSGDAEQLRHLSAAYDQVQREFKALADFASAAARRVPGDRTQYRPNHFAARRFADEMLKAFRSARTSKEGKVFGVAAKSALRALSQIVWITDSTKVAYLQPLFNLTRTQGYVTIGTLNYDNSIELAASAGSIPVHTGIQEWSETGHIHAPSEGVFLLKLHGSIDWRRDQVAYGALTNRVPHDRYYCQEPPVQHPHDGSFTPALIFGGPNKLTASGPYLDLLAAFRDELEKADRLTVVGYSFRDDHVNEFISRWINAFDEHQLRIVSPAPGVSSIYMAHLLDKVRTRMERIEATAAIALENLFGPFEMESSPTSGKTL
jgi:hypothetical protein